MKLPDDFRPFTQEDWYGLAGAGPLPSIASKDYFASKNRDELAKIHGPFIASIPITHEDQTEEVELVVGGDEDETVNIGFILAQGEELSMRLDERGNGGREPVGIVEIARRGLTMDQAEALINVLATLPKPLNVTTLTAMGFTLL
jgi:hypothetical protein